MGAYSTVVVGTDGSGTSLRAVARTGARDTRGDEAVQVTGSTPAESTATRRPEVDVLVVHTT